MRYCVVKDTVTVIDGSENPDEIMLQNAFSSGFTEGEVEILTAEEYQTRFDQDWALRPTPPPSESDRITAMEDLLMEILLG